MGVEKLLVAIIIFNTITFQSAYSQDGSGHICINAEPLCGSSQFSYSNTSGLTFAESGPDYGCLGAPLNPSWFYFQTLDS